MAKVSSVAVLGGSLSEPELSHLTSKIEVFGIDGQGRFLDLNRPTPKDVTEKFDLVLSSQTLEHLWNHKAFFDNLTNLCKTGGLVWVNCPASNFPHGSPDYYSAGFTSDYLNLNLIQRGFEIIHSETIASRRNYLARHSLGLWINERENRFPLRYLSRFSKPLDFLDNLRKYFFGLLVLSCMKDSKQDSYGVETLCFARLTR
jgi:2-polyprenyl-3-methyl-5-hydroxy-6-metoxy-1,4-benzoquinol methylase